MGNVSAQKNADKPFYANQPNLLFIFAAHHYFTAAISTPDGSFSKQPSEHHQSTALELP